MAISNEERPKNAERLDEFPDVRLDWAHDTDSDPSELTVFDPREPDVATAWITVDRETGVPLDLVR